MHQFSEEEITQAYLDMSNTPEGEIILADIKESFFNIFPFTPETTDTNQTIFREGMRWVAGYILDQTTPRDPEETQDNHQKGLYL